MGLIISFFTPSDDKVEQTNQTNQVNQETRSTYSDETTSLIEKIQLKRPDDLSERMESQIYLKLVTSEKIVKKIGYLYLETAKVNLPETIQRDPIKRRAFFSEEFRFFTLNRSWFDYFQYRLNYLQDNPEPLIIKKKKIANRGIKGGIKGDVKEGEQVGNKTIDKEKSKGKAVNEEIFEIDSIDHRFELLQLDPIQPNIVRKALTQKVRLQTWRQHTGGLMDGTCFSCLKKIKLDGSDPSEMIPLYGQLNQVKIKDEKDPYRWECGHILSSKDGGPDLPSNLRPLCFECNRAMSSKHMYIFMIKNQTKGLLFLEQQEPELSAYLKLNLSRIILWEKKIHFLVKKNIISREESNKMHHILYNKESSSSQRDEILEKIEQIQQTVN